MNCDVSFRWFIQLKLVHWCTFGANPKGKNDKLLIIMEMRTSVETIYLHSTLLLFQTILLFIHLFFLSFMEITIRLSLHKMSPKIYFMIIKEFSREFCNNHGKTTNQKKTFLGDSCSLRFPLDPEFMIFIWIPTF